MGFFATFWSWLNGQLTTYIGTNTARLAGVLEPTFVTLATLYVMAWGYLHLTGRIEEPFVAGLKRIITLAVVLGVGLNLWLYNTVIVDTFYSAPASLAAAVVGAGDPVGTIDAIWDSGGTVAGYLWARGGFSLEFTLAAGVVWCLVGLLCVYAMFLIALSDIALAVLLALGPLFIALLFFDSTRRLFSAWIAQLANYALITIITVMIAALLLQVCANLCGADGGERERHRDRGRVEHGADRGARVFDFAPGHADRLRACRRPRTECVGLAEWCGPIGPALDDSRSGVRRPDGGESLRGGSRTGSRGRRRRAILHASGQTRQ